MYPILYFELHVPISPTRNIMSNDGVCTINIQELNTRQFTPVS